MAALNIPERERNDVRERKGLSGGVGARRTQNALRSD